MHRLLVVVVLLSLASGVRAEEPTPAPSDAAPSVVSVGARAGINAAFALFPMAGVSAGLTSRFRFTETFSVEPHVDGVLDQFFVIGFMQGQLGLPVVASGAWGDPAVRHHVGFGPLVGHGSFVGHINDAKPLTLVGGEGVVGTDWAVAPSWDLRFQARAWAMSPIDFAYPFVGVMATLGVMYGL